VYLPESKTFFQAAKNWQSLTVDLQKLPLAWLLN
jgi:hypothetical protein